MNPRDIIINSINHTSSDIVPYSFGFTQEARKKITKESDEQIAILRKRELSADARLIAYAEVEMQVFKIEFDNGKTHVYLPCLGRFG